MFSIRISKYGSNKFPGTMTNLRDLEINIGNFSLHVQFASRLTHWRYCKLCKQILDEDGCTNPRCANHPVPGQTKAASNE